ncbi:MAG: maleate isomerase [Chloroflexota bacterium]|nr:maleate isomerase [Chloroflexota bacterium]
MTYWIGRVDPSMWWQGAWWQELLPADVRLAILSLGVRRLVDEELEIAHRLILEKVELLDREGVDVINVGGSPVVGVHGRAGHDRLLADIGQATQRPFVTALQAEIEAIRALGSRVAVASPYPRLQTERRVQALRDYGVEVIGHESLDIERNRTITELEFADVRTFAIEVARTFPQADVLYLPCGALPVTRVIAEVERETGMAVVTNVQAQAAATLGRIGYPSPVQGFGRLLEQLGAPTGV